jgi:hypothetical protein
MMTGEQITQALVAALMGRWESPSGDWREELAMQAWSAAEIDDLFEQRVGEVMATLPEEAEE